MQYKFTATQPNPNDVVLSLALFKQYLRIERGSEDLKLQGIIDDVVDLFQRSTGYIFRAGDLQLEFSIKDNVSYDKGKQRTYASVFQRNEDAEWADHYLTDLGVNVSTQKPKALSFLFNNGEEERVLDANQLANLVPDNFIIVLSKYPFIFKLPRSLGDLQSELDFNRFGLNNVVRCTLAVGGMVVPNDLRQCIIRMASALYENPDISVAFEGDSLISSTIHHYNFSAGL